MNIAAKNTVLLPVILFILSNFYLLTINFYLLPFTSQLTKIIVVFYSHLM